MVMFRSTAQTAMLENGSHVYITERCNFSFDTFTVKRGGHARMKKVSGRERDAREVPGDVVHERRRDIIIICVG